MIELLYLTLCVFVYIVPVLMIAKNTRWIVVLIPLILMYLSFISMYYSLSSRVLSIAYTTATYSYVFSLLVLMHIVYRLNISYLELFYIVLSTVFYIVALSISIIDPVAGVAAAGSSISLTMLITLLVVWNKQTRELRKTIVV